MDYLNAILCLFCVTYSTAETLSDISNNLQTLDKLLNKLQKENAASRKCDLDGLKTELKLFIKEEVKRKTDKWIEDDRVMRALTMEKTLRKKLQENVNAITEELEHKNKTIMHLENRLDEKVKEDKKRDSLLASCLSDLDNTKTELSQYYQEFTNFKDDTRLLHSEMSVCKDDVNDKFDLAKEACFENTRQQLANSMSTLDGKITEAISEFSSREKKVAFSAKIGSHYKDLSPWQTLVFGAVSLNIGQGYSGATGKFTAPVKGIYVFHVHITGSDNRALEISLRHNESDVLLLYVRGPGHGTDSGAVTLALSENDVVRVAKHGPWGSRPFYVHGWFSSFSGFLLAEA